ncbi:MAG: hypothetical protein J6Y95_03400 [Lachnospiraceae bacterium]|nr:hypothetical protein [Lachnospiraceae bacterium]
MNRTLRKGKYGYLRRKKILLLVISIVLALGVAGMYLIGYFTSGRSVNLMTLFALLTAIPFAICFTNFISLLPFKCGSEEEYQKIKALVDPGILDSELVIANKDGRSYFLRYAVILREGIFAYTPDPKMKTDAAVPYIRNFLRLNESDAELTIFTDLEAFQEKIGRFDRLDRDTCDEKYLRQEGTLIAISM